MLCLSNIFLCAPLNLLLVLNSSSSVPPSPSKQSTTTGSAQKPSLTVLQHTAACTYTQLVFSTSPLSVTNQTMQPALLLNVRTNLSHLASSASTSSTSSSIRSLSPSRRPSYLRSRSASPSPRRFASVLAYHATPPPGGDGRKSSTGTAAENQQQPQPHSAAEERASLGVSDNDNRNYRSSTSVNSQDREESPSRLARLLEGSRKRLDVDSSSTSNSSSTATSGNSLSTSNSALVSPLLRTASPSPSLRLPSPQPSPLSRPPYRELIECASVNNNHVDTKSITSTTNEAETARGSGDTNGEDISSSAAANDSGEDAAHSIGTLPKDSRRSSSEELEGMGGNDHRSSSGRTIAMTEFISTNKSSEADQACSSSQPTLSSRTPSAPTSSSSSPGPITVASTGTGIMATRSARDYFQHGYTTTFLASNEARLILDLPPLLGKDPNMIAEVLATPIPKHATRPASRRRSSSPPSTSSALPEAGAGSTATMSDVNAKAEAAAKAMTKRYAAKNLNMTETEAHRMVQLMAAEIVSLHEERELMLNKLERAKQEMLEAARLLRMKAAGTQVNVVTAAASADVGQEMQEMKDVTAESRVHKDLEQDAAADRFNRTSKADEDEDEDERKRRFASFYNKDDWKA